MEFGAGLWCLQATATAPRSHSEAYRSYLDDARSLEADGYDSLWLSEHHFFYDGYCPALLPAAAAALAVTSRMRLATGMLLSPLQDPDRLTQLVTSIASRHPGRLDVGLGLGYRDVELDGKGVRRTERAARHRALLERLRPAAAAAGATIWIGSATPRAVARAGAQGLPIMLSGANPLPLVRELVEAHRSGWEGAGRPGGVRPRVAALRNVWLSDDPREIEAARDWQRASYVLYAGLGWSVAEHESTRAMDFTADADAAIRDAVATMIAGPAPAVRDGLLEVADAGVDEVIFRVAVEGAPAQEIRRVLGRLADEVLPELRPIGAAA